MTEQVIVERAGRLGVLTLNRPEAINSLSLAMVQALTGALEDWRRDDEVSCVFLRGAGQRGFCAGGDVILVRDSIRAGEPQVAREFWRREYELNARIARYPKPIVALMEGVVMGGGIGLAGHASHRLVVPGAAIAMPEVKIGLAPDVGGSFLLARAPGESGIHLALTGEVIGARDAIHCGLADAIAPTEAHHLLVEALSAGDVEAALGSLRPAPVDGESDELTLPAREAWIDSCYSHDSVEGIVAALERHPDPAAHAAAAEIGLMSPLALKVTLEAIRRARSMAAVEECLEQDFRVSSAFLSTHDLPEGIRAVLVDKDRRPRWDPTSLAAVSEPMVARHFAPVADEIPLPVVQS
ncbi:MAG: enoyl-CoA hydratase/isomerase family protein [Solirubrobacterales bacterium]